MTTFFCSSVYSFPFYLLHIFLLGILGGVLHAQFAPQIQICGKDIKEACAFVSYRKQETGRRDTRGHMDTKANESSGHKERRRRKDGKIIRKSGPGCLLGCWCSFASDLIVSRGPTRAI